ncbi:hypothetical protein M5D96_014160 [Drosophila gunungcola]|uniref:Uncharacterized protein n=1 Tax=Drosophila gunungcola TaxID=103775 RepID=A0A9P9YA14_9MUSC|nr:hypothetical protein M5D96_014160 [Drosophila gunungcola]
MHGFRPFAPFLFSPYSIFWRLRRNFTRSSILRCSALLRPQVFALLCLSERLGASF